MSIPSLIGKSFGFLSVVSRAPNNSDGSAMWNCLCVCGEKRVVAGTGLRAGRNKSCGCKSPRFKSTDATVKGMSDTRAYRIWVGMKRRCSPESNGKSRRLYFDKGIRVCDRWSVFGNFLEDMGHPEDWQSIDRIDGSKGYFPENCRWASDAEQANNTSANHIITAFGKTLSASQWASELGLKANTIICRIRRGITPENALDKNYKRHASVEKRKRERACVVCSNTFIPRTSQIRDGVGLCCSQKCNGIRKKKAHLLNGELA